MSTKFRNYHSKEFYNQVLFESENFIVVPSLGALVEGWVLIVPKAEYLSFQYLEDDSLIKELETLSRQVEKIILEEYGSVSMFEHGACLPNSTIGCGVDYAHLHILPINFDLILGLDKFLDLKYEWNSVSRIDEFLLRQKEEKSEYLFYKDNNGNSYAVNNKEIPSQLFRKVIASYLNMSDKYDWKKYHCENNILKTVDRLVQYSLLTENI